MRASYLPSSILGPSSRVSSRRTSQELDESYLAIQSSVKSMGPAVAVVPVEAPIYRKERILGRGVGHISHKRINVVLVALNPSRVQVTDDCRRQDEVTIVEVVVIVVGIAKVNSIIARHVRARGDDAAPSA